MGVPAYLRFVNRRLGGELAAVGFAVHLSPNHLTAVSAALSALGIAAIALVAPTVGLAVGVTVALLAGYAFDSADGQLSRVRGDGKASGEWLDHVVDVVKTSSLHAAVLISLYRFGDLAADGWLLVPIGFSIVSITLFFALMLRDKLGGRPGGGRDGRGSAAHAFVLLPVDYGTLCLVMLTLAAPQAFLVTYTALFAFTLAFTARSLVKTYRGLAAA
ncbi:CDP-alcohol phosphatidyltransferase family protein [soil metagenome]